MPETLITQVELEEKARKFQPQWVPLTGKAISPLAGSGKAGKSIGVVQKKLSNGIRVNLKSLQDEPQRANIRLYVPGGRLLES